MTNEQETRIRICMEWLENWDIFDRLITGYESWIFAYDPEMQRQSREWKTPKEPRTKKVGMSKSQTKAIIVTFFDCCGIISKHWDHVGKLNYFEQRVVLKFFVKCGKSWQETLVALQTMYSDYIMLKFTFYEWHKLFTEGREDCNNVLLSGHPLEMLDAISR